MSTILTQIHLFCKERGLIACNEYLKSITSIKDSNDEVSELFELLGIEVGISKSAININIKKFIDFIESRFNYIRFNHLENRFELYELRHTAVSQAIKNLDAFSNYTKEYIMRIFEIEESKIEAPIIEKQAKTKQLRKFYRKNILNMLDTPYQSGKKFFGKEKDLILKVYSQGLGLENKATAKKINEELEKNEFQYRIKEGRSGSKRYIQITKVN